LGEVGLGLGPEAIEVAEVDQPPVAGSGDYDEDGERDVAEAPTGFFGFGHWSEVWDLGVASRRSRAIP
jgi:hypothetical protein